jgi:hypothetical protein
MKPDVVQWSVVCELIAAHPETITVEELGRLHPGIDVEESVARLLIDGLAVRFGDWVKASAPAVRYDELARTAAAAADAHRIHAA